MMNAVSLEPLVNPLYTIKQSVIIAQTEQMRVIDQTLAPGESVPWHLHPDSDDYIICLRGQLEVREGEPESVTNLRPLERHLVPKGKPHTTMNTSDQECQFLIVQGPGRVAFRARPEIGTQTASLHGGRVMRARKFLGLTVLSLAACGGGGGSEPDRYQQAVDQANQTEAAARALGVPSPCQQDQQCGLLTFLEPTACPTQTYQIYSTVSATAVAAAAAASQQVTLAQQAIALNPNPPQPCPLFPVRAPPTPVCVANVCQPG